jgi:cobalt-zinc-cadmium efflux system protein
VAHGGHHHPHRASDPGDGRRLATALALIVSLLAAEVVAGVLAHSLALLSDAAHMLTDAAALGLSLVVLRLVRRPSGGNVTFGLKRAEILSAQANGLTLLVLAGLVVYGAVRRLVTPPHPGGAAMIAVALAGAVVNVLALRQLAGANRESLNVEGAFQHVATDLFAFAATAAAGALILWTGFNRADGIAALLIAVVMLRSAWNLLRTSGRILLEIAPEGVDVDDIGAALAAHPGVVQVHDLHVWELASDFTALSAHVLVEPEGDCHGVRRALEAVVRDRFGIRHTTLQVDHAPRELVTIRPLRPGGRAG